MAFPIRIPAGLPKNGFPGRTPLRRLAQYLGELPPGDRFIAAVLGIIVAATSILGALALVRSFLVTVPVPGGSLTEGVIGAPRFVNPLLAISDTDRDLTSLTYAGLMGYDEGGNLVPVLAESFTRSEDQKTYTFVLREGATFHDGSPVTSEDVVFTIARTQDPALKSPERANWANIQVEAVDARTIRFTLPQPYAPFLEESTLGILPARLWRDVSSTQFPFSSYAERPVGAGPFKVARVTRAKDGSIARYELTAFEDYALGRPYLDTVRFAFFPDQVKLAAALKNGSIDSAHGIPDETARRVPYSRVFGVFFNPAAEPLFEDRAVRKALSLALDREGLVRDVLGGYGRPAIGPVPAGIGVPPLPIPDSARRLEDTRAALESGDWAWDDGAQRWQKNGRALEVTIKTSNAAELRTLAAKVQNDWQSLGVPVQVEFYAPGELTQNVIRPRTYGALLFGEVVGSYPDLYAFWASSARTDPGLNITGYANPEVDRLLETARTNPDRTQALNALAEANALIASEYPAAFTHTPDFAYVLPARVRGVNLTSVGAPTDRLRGIRYWYVRVEQVWPWFLK